MVSLRVSAWSQLHFKALPRLVGRVIRIEFLTAEHVSRAAREGDPLAEEVLLAAARANTLPEISADIVPAALGDDAPMWGAIALAASVTDV